MGGIQWARSPSRTGPRSITTTGARVSRSSSATAGRSPRMRSRTRCSSWPRRVIAASRTTAAAMAARASRGTEMTWTPTRTNLAALVQTLGLENAIHVATPRAGARSRATSAGTATGRVAKAVLIGAIPPVMVKSPTNPGGTPIEAFDQLRSAVLADRSQFWKDLTLPFLYGYNRKGAKVSEGVRESFWLQGMMAGLPASYSASRPSPRRTSPRTSRSSTCRRSSSTATTTRSCPSPTPRCSPPRS